MAWLRIGDNVITHPMMSRLLVATGLDHQQKNEAFGVLTQIAAGSAAHLTDGIVEMGSLAQVAPGRERAVLDVLKTAGIAEETKLDGRYIVRLILDDEEFVHMRRREEVEQDRNRAKDKRTPGLLAQVRVRDGDVCRWCAKSVSWSNRRGRRAATYDSLTKHKNSTVDTLVVSCKTCNSRRGNGEELHLKPEPENPIYSQKTVDFVNKDQWCIDHGIRIELSAPQLPLDISQDADGQGSALSAAHLDSGAPADVQERNDEAATAAHSTGSSASMAGSSVAGARAPLDDEIPEWVTASPEEMERIMRTAAHSTGSSASTAGSSVAGAQTMTPESATTGPQSATGLSASMAGSPAADDDPPKNLGRDPGRSGDAPGIVGSGRDGTGRVGPVRAGHESVKRRRRGSRGGRRRRSVDG
ncbi:HNH endonuclease [Corynebacterium phoceense]